jgi:hypothetical protein
LPDDSQRSVYPVLALWFASFGSQVWSCIGSRSFDLTERRLVRKPEVSRSDGPAVFERFRLLIARDILRRLLSNFH